MVRRVAAVSGSLSTQRPDHRTSTGSPSATVATKVTGSLDRWGCWRAAWTVPTASAITQARKRLGREVFAELFERCCGPVAGPAGPAAENVALGTARGSFLRRWRLLGIDGFE